MATQIIMTVDEGLTETEVNTVRHLFADALADFQTARYPVRAYVEQRYPDNGIAGAFTWDEKTQEVQRRVDLASKLHNPVLRAMVVHAPYGGTHTNHAMCATPCSLTCMNHPPFSVEKHLMQLQLVLHEEMHAGFERGRATVVFLQSVLGMSEEDARATFNQLEDKRIASEMRRRGL